MDCVGSGLGKSEPSALRGNCTRSETCGHTQQTMRSVSSVARCRGMWCASIWTGSIPPCRIRCYSPHQDMGVMWRPGRERAHRWYRLLDEWWPDSVLPQPGTDTLVAMSAGQLPRFCGSRNLRAAHDRTIGIELKGCGTQATVPPTMTGHGPRAWRGGLLGEPACVEYLEIMSAVERLAGAIGWHGAASQPLPKRCQTIDREDWQVLARAQKARNGARFDAMWNATGATSEQDAALVRMLAFWTQDMAQLERLWLQSPCGQRPKTQGREDYRRRTIAFVLRGCRGR